MQNKKEKQAENIATSTKFVDFVRFYALPIFSIGIFLLIIFNPVLGQINVLFERLGEIDQLKQDNIQAQSRIDKLVQMQQQNTQNAQLIEIINKLVPTGNSEVVKFRQRIADTSVQNGLELQTTKLSEGTVQNDIISADELDRFSLVQIPSEFDVIGEFPNFRSYLNDMYDGREDFFVINEMDLNSSPSQSNPRSWLGGFNLTKYQFLSGKESNLRELFLTISENQSPDPEVMEFLRERYLIE